VLLASGVLRSEGNPGGVRVGSSERIVDVFVLCAAGSAVGIFVVFVIPRFGHVDLQAQSATYQGVAPGRSRAEFDRTGTHRAAGEFGGAEPSVGRRRRHKRRSQ
jgi:hypothetical protein